MIKQHGCLSGCLNNRFVYNCSIIKQHGCYEGCLNVGYMHMRIWMQIHGYMDTWIHGYLDVWIHGYIYIYIYIYIYWAYMNTYQPFVAVSQLPAALCFPDKNTPLDV